MNRIVLPREITGNTGVPPEMVFIGGSELYRNTSYRVFALDFSPSSLGSGHHQQCRSHADENDPVDGNHEI